MSDYAKEISQLSPEEQIALLTRRLQRSELARQEAESLLERRARELDLANKELRKREEGLRERLDLNNRQLLAAQRTAGIATIYRERGGKIAFSPEFGRILGLPETQQVDTTLLVHCMHPLDRKRIAKEEEKFYAEQTPGVDHTYEHRIRREDSGQIRWLRWTLRRQLDEHGKFVSVSGTVQDITEQRQATRRARALGLVAERRVQQLSKLSNELEAARQAEQQVSSFLQAILDTVPQGIAVFDANLKLQVWNSPLADIIEFDRTLLRVGMPFMAAPPLGSAAGQQPAQPSQPERDASGRVIDQSYERELSDGRIVQVDIVGRDDGSMVRIYSDISPFKQVESELRLRGVELTSRVEELTTLSAELRKSRAEAEQANRYKSQFLAMMSHDIRTPMNGVLGMLETLANTKLDDDQRKRLELARDSGRQLSVLLNDIIEIVRAESGKIDLLPEPLDIRRTLDGIASFWSTANENPELELHLELDESLPHRVMLDPTRFRQVVDNLVSNALKYTERGDIRVKAFKSGPMMRVEISDTGPGISPEEQKRLFADFSRLRDVPAATGHSAGLGLAICRRLVTAMEGDIGLESEVGKGSTFWFELPMAVAAEGPAPAPEAIAIEPEPVLLDAHVLVAEDIETNRIVVTSMLDQLGCTYECVPNGKEALEAASARSFDCVLMDVNMPVMDGREATIAIRELAGPQAQVPIIGVTAHVLPEMQEALLAAGMNALVNKPVSMDQLTITLQLVLQGEGEALRDALPLVDEEATAMLFEALPPDRRQLIVDQSLQDIEQLVAELSEADRLGQASKVQRAAHSLKGVAANIGANRLAGLVADSSSIDRLTVERVAAETVADLRRRFETPKRG